MSLFSYLEVSLLYPGMVDATDRGVLTLAEVEAGFPGALEMLAAQYPERSNARYLNTTWYNPLPQLRAAEGRWSVRWTGVCRVERSTNISQYGPYRSGLRRSGRGRASRVGTRPDDHGSVRVVIGDQVLDQPPRGLGY